ncbi:MAG TPA: PLP-dependent aminotransferase family protein [Duganella sp.]|nr:PLP-dependent aminotransferase family protein [Duganella sp.]
MNVADNQQLTAARGTTLNRQDLLPALADPRLDAINFLNEVIDRFPDAISFAPGAPFGGFFDDLDVGHYLDVYVRYLSEKQNLSAAQVRRRLYQYGPARGQINELLADALRMDEQIEVAPRDIVVTVGCQEAMVLVLRTLCPGPNDVLAVVNPCFAGIAGAAKVLGIETLVVEECGDSLALGELEAACAMARAQGKRVRALYVAPDYSNPSGQLLDLDARRHLLSLAARQDFLLIEDNAYGFTAHPDQALPTLKALDRARRVVYLGTCAKTCLPGVRVGFVVADQCVVDASGETRLLADELALVKSMVTVNTSPICQAIVGGMILEKGGSLAAVGREKAGLYRRNLGLLLAALDRHVGPQAELLGVSWNRPKGGFFVRMRLPVAADEALLDACGRQYGVLWTPMRNFYLNDGGRCEIRLSCSYLTDEEIDEGARRLARFLRAVCA